MTANPPIRSKTRFPPIRYDLRVVQFERAKSIQTRVQPLVSKRPPNLLTS